MGDETTSLVLPDEVREPALVQPEYHEADVAKDEFVRTFLGSLFGLSAQGPFLRKRKLLVGADSGLESVPTSLA